MANPVKNNSTSQTQSSLASSSFSSSATVDVNALTRKIVATSIGASPPTIDLSAIFHQVISSMKPQDRAQLVPLLYKTLNTTGDAVSGQEEFNAKMLDEGSSSHPFSLPTSALSSVSSSSSAFLPAPKSKARQTDIPHPYPYVGLRSPLEASLIPTHMQFIEVRCSNQEELRLRPILDSGDETAEAYLRSFSQSLNLSSSSSINKHISYSQALDLSSLEELDQPFTLTVAIGSEKENYTNLLERLNTIRKQEKISSIGALIQGNNSTYTLTITENHNSLTIGYFNLEGRFNTAMYREFYTIKSVAASLEENHPALWDKQDNLYAVHFLKIKGLDTPKRIETKASSIHK